MKKELFNELLQSVKEVINKSGKLKVTLKVHGNVKCDCGHTAKFHYLHEGCCDKCGCTWYYPNVYYMKKKHT